MKQRPIKAKTLLKGKANWKIVQKTPLETYLKSNVSEERKLKRVLKRKKYRRIKKEKKRKDHMTMFSYRHSLNGREDALHLKGRTGDYPACTEVIRWLEVSIIISVLFPSVPGFCPTAERTANRSRVGRWRKWSVFSFDSDYKL